MSSHFPDTDATLDATSRAVTAEPGPGTTRTTTAATPISAPRTILPVVDHSDSTPAPAKLRCT